MSHIRSLIDHICREESDIRNFNDRLNRGESEEGLFWSLIELERASSSRPRPITEALLRMRENVVASERDSFVREANLV